MPADDTAYDGFSNRPQERELSPLERDILTRILPDIIGTLRRTEDLDSLVFMDGKGAIRMEAEEVPRILEMRRTLDPRED